MIKKQIILFGAPGAGKGTQAKILASKLNVPHISTGDILREAVSKGTELGEKAKTIMEAGELVPDEIMGGIIKEVLMSEKCKEGYILDGFPRTTKQAELLDQILSHIDLDYPVVIELNVEDEIIVHRLSMRRMCSNCGYIVNLESLENQDVCPNCGAKNSFIKRKDDDEAVIRNRLKVYHESTKPVLKYYEGKTEIIIVDGTQSVEQVSELIISKLS